MTTTNEPEQAANVPNESEQNTAPAQELTEKELEQAAGGTSTTTGFHVAEKNQIQY
jgi:hypothetical protein